METDKQYDISASDATAEEEPAVLKDTDVAPTHTESESVGQDDAVPDKPGPTPTTVEFVQVSAPVSTVSGNKCESLLDSAPLKSNE
ncbi:hypothetical protein DSO57_1027542 [Entomophthora muscae]|uniref:Uncharacterized protein n=1 Tax=Entomophthora muscae TaxID=34485 RepID=A0ACC2RSS4_9FUNG|nr:hypothetical protein DSO57_1027542 [Entomophthora muscae]